MLSHPHEAFVFQSHSHTYNGRHIVSILFGEEAKALLIVVWLIYEDTYSHHTKLDKMTGTVGLTC